jgi:undecaprenyl-diphosphatase
MEALASESPAQPPRAAAAVDAGAPAADAGAAAADAGAAAADAGAAAADAGAAAADARPPWRFNWLTPGRCRLILAVVLLLGFLGHLRYLTHDCPVDLSGDEAHYWDWSRQLDLSYYSKGPLVAYIIRASCAAFGRDTMWAVRFPALLFACGTGVVTYLLTLKLFRSDRLALGAVLLNGLVPMFIAGSVLMTIDPPFFFCWALSTYLAAHAIFDGRRWCWPLIGVVVGVGFLAKYAMLLWLPIVLIALAIDRRSRPILRTPGPWVASVVALLFTIPVIVWNQRHGWASLRHVAKQTGNDSSARFDPMNFLEFIGSQIGVMGPTLAVLMVAAVVWAWRNAKRAAAAGDDAAAVGDASSPEQPPADERWREMKFLLAIGLPFFVLTMLTSIRAKVQPNWPAPAYFTLLILTAYFLGTRLQSRSLWKPWRWWFYATVQLGLMATPILHNTELTYPFARWWHDVRNKEGVPSARKFDPTVRLKGWQELGDTVTREREALGPGTFVLGEDYQTTGEMAFYVAGQPKTYYAGSYFTGERRKRHSQYDLWPDRSLDVAQNPSLAGKNAVYVGWINDDIRNAFERVEPMVVTELTRRGVVIRTMRYTRCYGFKGMKQPEATGSF